MIFRVLLNSTQERIKQDSTALKMDPSLQQLSRSLTNDDFKVSGWCGNRCKCVSIAIKPQGVAIRDTKDPSKATLLFTKDEWSTFIKGAKDGQFDVKA